MLYILFHNYFNLVIAAFLQHVMSSPNDLSCCLLLGCNTLPIRCLVEEANSSPSPNNQVGAHDTLKRTLNSPVVPNLRFGMTGPDNGTSPGPTETKRFGTTQALLRADEQVQIPTRCFSLDSGLHHLDTENRFSLSLVARFGPVLAGSGCDFC